MLPSPQELQFDSALRSPDPLQWLGRSTVLPDDHSRAIEQATAYQTREVLDAMNADSGVPLTALKVDGGMVFNNLLIQFQADILGVPVIRSTVAETTALGAAFLAGLAAGVWKDTAELESFWKADRRFEPRMEDSRREELYEGWKHAVARV